MQWICLATPTASDRGSSRRYDTWGALFRLTNQVRVVRQNRPWSAWLIDTTAEGAQPSQKCHLHHAVKAPVPLSLLERLEKRPWMVRIRTLHVGRRSVPEFGRLSFPPSRTAVLDPRYPVLIGPAVRADFRRLYPANAKTATCCPSDDHRTKVTNSVTSARSLWWHVGPYFWPADLTRTANPILSIQE